MSLHSNVICMSLVLFLCRSLLLGARMCIMNIMAGAGMRMRLFQGTEENKVQKKSSMGK